MKIVLISIISSDKYGNTGVDFIAASLRKNIYDTVDVKYYHRSKQPPCLKPVAFSEVCYKKPYSLGLAYFSLYTVRQKSTGLLFQSADSTPFLQNA